MSGNDERPVSIIKKTIDFETAKALQRQIRQYLDIMVKMRKRSIFRNDIE